MGLSDVVPVSVIQEYLFGPIVVTFSGPVKPAGMLTSGYWEIDVRDDIHPAYPYWEYRWPDTVTISNDGLTATLTVGSPQVLSTATTSRVYYDGGDVGFVDSIGRPIAAFTVSPIVRLNDFREPAMPNLNYMLNYPTFGIARTQVHEGAPTTGDTAPTKGLLYLGDDAQGLVREIKFITYLGSLPSWGTNLKKWRLRVWVNRGAIADLASPPADPDIDIPISALLGGYLNPSEPATTQTCKSSRFDSYYKTDGFLGNIIAFNLRYPIPYTDGILIQIGTLNGSTWTPDTYFKNVASDYLCYSYVHYEAGTLPYAGMKLKSNVMTGAFTYPDATPTWINEASGAGFLAHLWAAIQGTTGSVETNWTLKIDGDTGNGYQASGTEDWFAINQCYSFAAGAAFEWLDGVFYKSVNAGVLKWEAHRTFEGRPVAWTDGCVATYPVTLAASQIVALYYQEAA